MSFVDALKRWSAALAIFAVLCFGGWITHLYNCFTQDEWGFLIAGAIFFPIGVIHGWGIWLGLWM
jgi:hypothetical protein